MFVALDNRKGPDVSNGEEDGGNAPVGCGACGLHERMQKGEKVGKGRWGGGNFRSESRALFCRFAGKRKSLAFGAYPYVQDGPAGRRGSFWRRDGRGREEKAENAGAERLEQDRREPSELWPWSITSSRFRADGSLPGSRIGYFPASATFPYPDRAIA